MNAIKETKDRQARGQPFLDPDDGQQQQMQDDHSLCERCVRESPFTASTTEVRPIVYSTVLTRSKPRESKNTTRAGKGGHPSRAADGVAKPT